MKEKNVKFYGLLHIAEDESSSVQLEGKSIVDQIAVYVKNASTLASSLGAAGYTFVLLTNQSDTIQQVVSELSLPRITIETASFTREIPSGIRFYSAHFKLDLYRHFSKQDEQYSILCDLDMMCTGRPLKSFDSAISAQRPLYYDISDQIGYREDPDIAFRDIELIEGESDGVWCGGEFIAGNSQFFAKLADEVDSIFPNYIKVIDRVSHVGDEAVTSVAIQRLRRSGVYIQDAGLQSIVGRFWNCARFLPFERDQAFYEGCFLMHLPADKEFLARLSGKASVNYRKAFYFHRRWSLASMVVRIKRIVRWVIRKPE